jgi:hypothetical protein
MAVTFTQVGPGPLTKSWNVTASANTDEAVQIPHSFQVNYQPVVPEYVTLVPLQPEFYTKQWTLGVVDDINININSAVSTGGALAGTPQMQVIAMLPASIIE